MRWILIVVGIVLIGVGVSGGLRMRTALAGEMQTPKTAGGSLWDLELTTLEGDPAPLNDYAGKVALVVNVASKCGLTPQYEGLEALYGELAESGFVILGFPSNDFLGQEPGTPAEIRAFCDAEYGVTFPLFAKVLVKGDERDQPYGLLTAAGLQEPTWNFTKYLVGRDGRVIARFSPKTAPDDADLRAAIDAALADS